MLACVLALLTSCEKDYTKVDNLAGTTWKCSNTGGVEYVLIIFTSTSTAEFWVKERGEAEYQDGICSYSVYDNRIHFTYEGETYITGTIDKDVISAMIEDEAYFFIKQ